MNSVTAISTTQLEAALLKQVEKQQCLFALKAQPTSKCRLD